MKLGRNDPCYCGSGKKHKHCCMNSAVKQLAKELDDIEKVIVMNPNLTLDELDVVMHHKMQARNNQPNIDFCGLSSNQIENWLYAPFSELSGVKIKTPDNLSASPVMCYLALILDEAMQNGGSFKATSKGNLPAKLVKQASALLPEFAVSQFETHISISEFAGSNEDKFNALHYTRILAEIAGIIYRRSGQYHVKKAAQKQYQRQGIQAFFKPMLEAATAKYNWGYLDGWEQGADLRIFWLFMLWRLQSHSNVEQLTNEVVTAFPALLQQLATHEYFSPINLLSILIESRFITRFLEFWGFVIVDPKRFFQNEPIAIKLQLQPLLAETFQFNVKFK